MAKFGVPKILQMFVRIKFGLSNISLRKKKLKEKFLC